MNEVKQPLSIYTVMLILSTVFMLIAVIAMWRAWGKFGEDGTDTSSARPQVWVVGERPTVG